MTSSVLDDAIEKIASFNESGLHYNLVANAIHKQRVAIENPFSQSFLPYLIAGLISFDMGRMMGTRKYILDGNSFASRLNSKLQDIRHLLEPLMKISLTQINLQEHQDAIIKAYTTLSSKGIGALHENPKKSFHVGATKILFFLNPELFIIIDSNAARAFRAAWDIPFRNTAQHGYSADRYLECMKCAQKDILEYGEDQVRSLDPDIPLTRVYDELTFVMGANLK